MKYNSAVTTLSRVIYGLFFFLSLGLTSCVEDDPIPVIPEESCSDGIRNQGEIDVDCGGPCPPCVGSMTAVVNSNSWESSGNLNSILNAQNQSLLIAGTTGSTDISIIHNGPLSPGTYNISSAIYSESNPAVTYLSFEGQVIFTKWDHLNNVVAGAFSFKAVEATGTGDTVIVTNGSFNKVVYQE